MQGFFSLFLLLFLFSVTIYLNLFGLRYELRVLDTYLFNERFLNAHWVPHLWWPPKVKRHLKTGVIPGQGFSAQVSYTLSKPLELHSSYIKWPMYTFITKILLFIHFSKVLCNDNFQLYFGRDFDTEFESYSHPPQSLFMCLSTDAPNLPFLSWAIGSKIQGSSSPEIRVV